MRTNKPRWSPQQAVFAGREARSLLEAHGDSLKDRLPADTVDQIEKDATALEAAMSGRPAYGAEARATTGTEQSVADDAEDLAARMRALLRHVLPKGDPVLRAAGVGMKPSKGKASVAARLEAMINASADHPETFKAAGILDSDIALCRTLHDQLLASEHSHEDARITRKELTRDKNITQRHLEDAVIAVSLAGALVFRADPILVAAFKNLIPTPSSGGNNKKGKPDGGSPPGDTKA